VCVSVEFIFPRPKGHYGTGRNSQKLKDSAPKYCTSKSNGDIDKVVRSTLDALSLTSGGCILTDDSLVVCLQALKRYANNYELAGAKINIKTF